MKQYFKPSEISGGDTIFKLQYTKVEQTIAGPWSFDLKLSKKLMESGTIKTALNAPLEAEIPCTPLNRWLLHLRRFV